MASEPDEPDGRPDHAAAAARWAVVVVWLAVPFLAGPALGDALVVRTRAVQVTGTVGLWATWAVGLVAVLVPSTVSLTVLRVLGPATFVACLGASVGGADRRYHAAALVVGALAVAAAGNRWVAHAMVNGSAYGPEGRYLLRTPGSLLLGPVEVAWLVIVVGVTAGPLLVAAGSPVLGVVAAVAGWPAAAFLARAMHGLSRRWLVLVPAGLVVHDYAALTESVLVPRAQVAHVGLALEGTTATDLTLGAVGPPLEVAFRSPVALSRRPGRRPGRGATAEVVEATGAMVAPARPIQFVADAARRHLPTGMAADAPPSSG